MEANAIPVVDLSSYNTLNGKHLDESSPELNKLAQEIYEAFTTVGFVYVKNHGVPESEISGLFKVAKNFFDLPQEKKNKFARTSTSNNHGYVALGVETIDPSKPTDFKEAFNATEPFNDDIPWPDFECSDFRPTLNNFFHICEKLTHAILDLVSLGLKLEDRTLMRRTHTKFGTPENKTTLRILNYPNMTELKEGQIRLGEHSDYGTFTLLFQDQIGGLEVRSRKEEGFIPASPIEGTILVNIGDLLQRWTNDELISTRHRVVVPRDELKRSTPRQSAAFFVHPDNDVIIECLDGSGHYPPISSLDYLNHRLDATYLNK